ncbi:MAG TPA: mannose-1-phosphate guanylyltransferase/mannose-6-phosphate isomerase [Alphaproteobacteria bacterium]|nr:mannose-1-phosphate guanylyltransferase/mannose-6-phosphate isomerase [Alphaproteobacteria bacterium]
MHAIVDLGRFRPQSSAQIHPVILSGGAGTRLWPLSRAFYPKQLLQLTSDRTLLQETVARGLVDSGFADPIVICNDEHRFLIDEQLRQIGVKPRQILLEPVARNTAPAIAVAALWLAAREPDALMLVQPSDHVIGSVEEFHEAVGRGVAAAQAGKLVTFGIKPTRAETGYGYIHGGDPLDGSPHVLAVEQFVEKPERESAQRFVESGVFFWNSGIFLFSARGFLDELRRLHPGMFDACSRAVKNAKEDLSFFRLESSSFGEAPSLSVDRAVMEHTENAVVIPVEMFWSDIGSWQALREVNSSDENGNVIHGDVICENVRRSYLRTEGKLIAAIGLEDVVVVATDDAVFVARADCAAEVSGIVEQLRKRNRSEPIHHTTVHRPWGFYRSVDTGDRFQVKRIMVKPGAKLSLQKHFHRAEHWVVVHGTALVQRGQETMLVRENESVYIPIGTEHRLENPGRVPLHLIEVQSGSYLGEDDIVRITDNYGRA